jgi:hypothetical protein
MVRVMPNRENGCYFLKVYKLVGGYVTVNTKTRITFLSVTKGANFFF